MSSSGKRRKTDNNKKKKEAERTDEKKATKLEQKNFENEYLVQIDVIQMTSNKKILGGKRNRPI